MVKKMMSFHSITIDEIKSILSIKFTILYALYIILFTNHNSPKAIIVKTSSVMWLATTKKSCFPVVGILDPYPVRY